MQVIRSLHLKERTFVGVFFGSGPRLRLQGASSSHRLCRLDCILPLSVGEEQSRYIRQVLVRTSPSEKSLNVLPSSPGDHYKQLQSFPNYRVIYAKKRFVVLVESSRHVQ